MKKIIYTAVFTLACSAWSKAQEVVAFVSLGHTDILQQDSILAIVNVGNPLYINHFQDSFLVTSDAILIYTLTQEDTTTLISSITWIEGLQVYPNPTFGNLILQKEGVPYNLEIDMFNANGILMKTYDWPAYLNSIQTNLATFAPGTYFILVRNLEGTLGNRYKILKQ